MTETDVLSKFEYAHIQLLPEFDGQASCSLDYFLARCDSFLKNFQRGPSAPQSNLINEFLFNVIKSKLKGEARSILDIEANGSYERFKEKLVRKYGDVKNERILLQEISNCYQRHNEDYTLYYERLCSLVLRYKSLCKLNYSDQILTLKLSEIDDLSLNTFKAGILEPYRLFLRYAQISDLPHALRICRGYDNDRSHESYMDQLRGSVKPHPSHPHKPLIGKPQLPSYRNPIPNPFFFLHCTKQDSDFSKRTTTSLLHTPGSYQPKGQKPIRPSISSSH